MIAVVGPKGVGKSTIISRVVRKTAVPEVLLSEEGGNQGELADLLPLLG